MRIVIVGAGLGGIAATIELQRHGFSDITILESAPEPGGTWFHNSYPGAACDVPSPLYSFSFAQRGDWTHMCAPQPAILRYVHDVAREYGVDRRVVHGAKVTACTWCEALAQWDVECEDGRRFEADAVIIATGQLHQPARPAVPGVEDFAGRAFHSAEWDHGYALEGKRVAVIGTGASAVQFVPEIAPIVGSMTVFQRSGNWFMARRNRPYPAALRWAIDHVPGLRRLLRRFYFHYGELLTVSIRHPKTVGRVVGLRSRRFMERQLADPEVRRKAWPDYTFGCKRVLFSSHFLPALQRPNVTLETADITSIEADAVVTADGARHEVDCIIWATGFRTNDFMFPMQITGRDGLGLEQAWAGGAHAHLGITMPGFPSMFVLYGPNTNTSGGSIIFYLERQAAYVRRLLALVRERGAAAVEVRPEVEAASDRDVQARFAGTAWTACDSWYRDDSGRIIANWPGYMREYARLTREVDEAQYTLRTGARLVAPESMSTVPSPATPAG